MYFLWLAREKEKLVEAIAAILFFSDIIGLVLFKLLKQPHLLFNIDFSKQVLILLHSLDDPVTYLFWSKYILNV